MKNAVYAYRRYTTGVVIGAGIAAGTSTAHTTTIITTIEDAAAAV
jgi:hypothetical protein